MFQIESLIAIALAFTVVTVSPGPANISTALTAMRTGRKSGIHFGLGLSFGLAFWGMVAATGLGAILQNSIVVLMVLKVVGGLYLLWLASCAAMSALRNSQLEAPQIAQDNWFVRGLFLNLTNPKAVIAWMAALSVGLDPSSGTAELMTATTTCIAIGFINYYAHAIAFSLNGVMVAYRRMNRWIEGVTAGLFAVAGFALIRSAFAR